MNGVLVIAGAAVAAGLGVLVPWLRRRRSAAALEGRESLDDEAFYGHYYAESKLPKTLVSELRHEVAETLKSTRCKAPPG